MKTKTYLITLFLVLFSMHVSFSQKKVKGKVSNTQGEALAGVIVTQKGNHIGTRTDIRGEYSLTVDSTTSILMFIFPGMQTQQIPVANRSFIQVKLLPLIQEEVQKSNTRTFSGTMKGSNKMTYHTGQQNFATSMAVQIPPQYESNTEDYSIVHESGFRNVVSSPLSTFSIDVDRASYSNIRRFINLGQRPPEDAVRIEEMLNYFSYDFSEPEGGNPVTISTEYSDCPWNVKNNLVLIGLQAEKIETEKLPASNLVFLIDVSGSMNAPNKLELVKSSLKMLVKQMRPQDKIALVSYAGSANLALESTPGSNKLKISTAIEQLKAGGSTAGGKGLEMAYRLASENFIPEGNNRIVLATDGDFNVGQTSDAEMEHMVEQQRDHQIYLTVLGFGMGNYKDSKLETIADNGNGNYAYIDNSQEAHKVLIQEFGGTLFTVAKDVKLQVEFNPQVVKAYRLIGYENRSLNNEDFNNDQKDAGEMGSGHQMVALYEIVPVESDQPVANVDALKYQKFTFNKKDKSSTEVLSVKLRYKTPTAIKSKLQEHVVVNKCSNFNQSSSDMQFAAAVTQFGMLLRDSDYLGNATLNKTIEIAERAKNEDKDGYKGEMIRLMKTAGNLGLIVQQIN